jgi:hypothetical protein
MEKIITYEDLVKRKTNVKRFAEEIGISVTYARQIIIGENKYPPSESVKNTIKSWLASCHVCGRKLNEH